MKVLIVHNRYRGGVPSGENQVVDQEAEALAERGVTVERFERTNDDIDEASMVERVLQPATVLWNGRARRDMGECLARVRPDVVHVHNTFPLLSTSILYACRAARVPIVASVHNYRLACANSSLWRDGHVCHACVGRVVHVPAVWHRCYHESALASVPAALAVMAHRRSWQRLVAAFIFLTESQRRIIVAAASLDHDRTFVRHNLVPRPMVAPAPRVQAVVFAGRLDRPKGIPFLMQAWNLFEDSARQSRLRLQIAGSGPMSSEVEAWAATRRNVDVLGVLDRDRCQAVMGAATAVVVPSSWEEPFGLVAVEAMALGVAPIAPDQGSFPELVVDGAEGCLFRAGDPQALARVLRDVDEHPQRYLAWGEEARRGYDRRFDPDDCMDALLHIYDAACQARSGAGPAGSRPAGPGSRLRDHADDSSPGPIGARHVAHVPEF